MLDFRYNPFYHGAHRGHREQGLGGGRSQSLPAVSLAESELKTVEP